MYGFLSKKTRTQEYYTVKQREVICKEHFNDVPRKKCSNLNMREEEKTIISGGASCNI